MPQHPFKNSGFINNSNDGHPSSTGLWKPHTASIDFCESNYLITDLVVEPHNVWSSLLGFTLLGIVGIALGNPTREYRTFLIYLILLIIGIGSACLHATLHWCFQSFDELPMIYLVLCGMYIVLEVDSPMGEQKHPHLAKYLILLSSVCTAVYYAFQQLYAVFLLSFISMTVLIFCLHIQIARRLYHEVREGKQTRINGAENKTKEIALRFYALHHIAYTLIASPIWVLDQFYCEYLIGIYNNLPYPLTGMTLHVAWHLCAGIGAHFFIQFLCACRADALGMVCATRRVLGVLPVVTIHKPKGKKV
jgi:dihydroceramidase